MRHCIAAQWLTWVVVPSAAQAALPTLADREVMQAATVVLSFDVLAQRCQANGGFAPGDASQVARWQREHRIDAVRSHLRTLAQSEPDRSELARARAQAEQQLAALQGAQACQGAVAATRQPMAQLATGTPGLWAALAGSKPAAAPAAPVRDGRAPSAAAQVQAFGFDTRMRMGAGGALWPVPVPVVLMRDGSALTEVEGLAHPGGLDAHRSANPKAWTQWRRSGGKLQLLKADKGWVDLPYSAAYERLPADFRLEGRYRSTSGAGTAAIGGTGSVAAWRSYEFGRDGRVLRGGGVGGRAESGGGGSTVTSARAPVQQGRYRIDGLTLRIQYDDGSTEQRLVVADPKDPKTALWLDGVGYTRQRD